MFYHSTVDMINYTCSICAIPFGSEDEVNWDSHPYVVGNFNGINMKCLIDTGASVSCLSREVHQSIPGYQALESVPIQPGFRISAASGHKFSLVGCFMINSWQHSSPLRDLQLASGSSDEMLQQFEAFTTALTYRLFPLKTTCYRSNDSPWIVYNICRLARRKRRLWKEEGKYRALA